MARKSSRALVTPLPDEPVRVVLPTPHKVQEIFLSWDVDHPEAQCLVAPAGTKTGKSFGASLWMTRELLSWPMLYNIWVAPTLLKARIGYRYISRMIPDCGLADLSDSRLTITTAEGSILQFLHGQNAETTIEGEAVDRFVLDEAGKLKSQVWHSLLTTITQTGGRGIVTGTPRGYNYYRDIFLAAVAGDPFFVWCQLKTAQSPYITAEAIEKARRLLPAWLFAQYYEAVFISMSTIFGDLSGIWDRDLKAVEPGTKLWLHPDAGQRKGKSVCIGVDWAKVKDYTVFFATNSDGKMVGFYRFRGGSYPNQVRKLKAFLTKFGEDVLLRHDATGVGTAIDDMLEEADLDCEITAVTFTMQSKAEMVTKSIVAVEEGWFKAPYIPVMEQEWNAYEVTVTKSGLMSFAGPDNVHDDTVSAGILSISGAYVDAAAAEAEEMIEGHLNDKLPIDKPKPAKPARDEELDDLADALAGGDDELDDDELDDDDEDYDLDPEMD